jgi:sugar lactone lactonase YvrE
MPHSFSTRKQAMKQIIVATAIAVALAACGGGGGSGNAGSVTPPPPPTGTTPPPEPTPPAPVPPPIPVPPLPDLPKTTGVVFGVPPSDDVPVAQAYFSYPEDVIEASDGTLYVSDTHAHVIRRVKDGTVSVFAGTFAAGYNGDGQKMATELDTPTGLQFSADEKFLIFSDSGNNLIRKVDMASGAITTISGKQGNSQLPADNAPALNNPIGYTASLRYDAQGNLFFPTTSETRIGVNGGLYYIDKQGVMHRKDVPNVGPFVSVRDVYFGSGYLDFVRENYFYRVFDNGAIKQRKLESAFGKGIIADGANTLVASNSTLLSLDAELKPTIVATGFANLTNIRKAKQGYLLTDSDQGVLYRYENGVKTQLTGTAPAAYGALVSVVKYGDNSVLILDNQRPRIFLLDLATGQSTLWAGTGAQGWSNPVLDKSQTTFYYPNGLAVDGAKNVYVVEQHRIVKITPAGQMSIFAGGDLAGDLDGPPGVGRFRSPGSIAVDAAGNLIVADTYNNKVRKVSPDGTVVTIAGNGEATLPTFGAQARLSSLNHPLAVAVTADGAVLIADGWNNEVVKMTADGILHPFAGKPNRSAYQGSGTYSGDNGLAVNAGMNTPGGLAVRGDTVYITDTFNHRLRAVGPDGVIRTIAGSVQGFMPGGKLLSFPREVTVVDDQVLVADTGNRNIVRYIVK